MPATVRIETRNRLEALELIETLARRGLTGRRVDPEGLVVEIRYEREQADRLLADAVAALEGWLGGRETPITVHDGLVRIGSATL